MTTWDGQSQTFSAFEDERILDSGMHRATSQHRVKKLWSLADRLEAENAVIRAQLETHHVAIPEAYTPDFLPVCPPPRDPK